MNKAEGDQHGQQMFHRTLKMSHRHKFQSGHILEILEPCNNINFPINFCALNIIKQSYIHVQAIDLNV